MKTKYIKLIIPWEVKSNPFGQQNTKKKIFPPNIPSRKQPILSDKNTN